MKTVLLFSIGLWAIIPPALAELTVQDLDKIRLIIKEEIEDEIEPIKVEISAMKIEIASVKKEVGSLKVDVASLSGRVEGVEKQITWLMGVIIVVASIPQVIMVWQSRKNREQEKRIEALAQEIETLKQQIANP